MFSILKNISTLYSKPLIGLAIASALSAFIYWYDGQRFDAGYNKAVIDMDVVVEAAHKASLEVLTEEYEHSIQIAKYKEKVAQEALQRLRDKPPRIEYREINKVVENSECKYLTNEYVGLLNQSYGEEPSK